ncbi:hypothetical protein ACH49M_09000 [Rhodococcus qingshengii]|uniref:hypothetical protein n=1 Tax=Rhodococcus qingshengii TaxID=334542 RepID=UPI0036F9F2FA
MARKDPAQPCFCSFVVIFAQEVVDSDAQNSGGEQCPAYFAPWEKRQIQQLWLTVNPASKDHESEPNKADTDGNQSKLDVVNSLKWVTHELSGLYQN